MLSLGKKTPKRRSTTDIYQTSGTSMFSLREYSGPSGTEIHVRERLDGVEKLDEQPYMDVCNLDIVQRPSMPFLIKFLDSYRTDFQAAEVTLSNERTKGEEKRQVCEVCTRRGVSVSPASILCFTCGGYSCKACDCTHPNSVKITTTKKLVEVDEVIDMFLEDMMNEPSLDIKTPAKADKIDVRHHLDETDCDISGLCVLRDGRLVAADYGNSALKIIRNDTIEIYLELSERPFDITEISDRSPEDPYPINQPVKLAVTFPLKETLLILGLDKKQIIQKDHVRIGAQCLGINYGKDNLFVVCADTQNNEKLQVQIFSKDGVKVQVVDFSDSNWVSGFSTLLTYVGGQLSSRDLNRSLPNGIELVLFYMYKRDGERVENFNWLTLEVNRPLNMLCLYENTIYILDSDRQNNFINVHKTV